MYSFSWIYEYSPSSRTWSWRLKKDENVHTFLIVNSNNHGQSGSKWDNSCDWASPWTFSLLNFHPTINVVSWKNDCEISNLFQGICYSPYLSVTDFLKSLFHEIDFLSWFLSISNLIFTTCVYSLQKSSWK